MAKLRVRDFLLYLAKKKMLSKIYVLYGQQIKKIKQNLWSVAIFIPVEELQGPKWQFLQPCTFFVGTKVQTYMTSLVGL